MSASSNSILSLDNIKTLLRKIRYYLFYYPRNNSNRICPVCEKPSRKFKRAGTNKRNDAQCSYCGALERHRFLWLFLQRSTDLFDPSIKNVLHFAPEKFFIPSLRNLPQINYLTTDLFSRKAMFLTDIMNIGLSASCVDVLLCSHVLEHVNDDRMALKEIYRVLKDTGWAAIQVPIIVDKTFEDPSITDPLQRLRIFGQKDHVRAYGKDFIERLESTGLSTNIILVGDIVEFEDAVRYGLTSASGQIYLSRKLDPNN